MRRALPLYQMVPSASLEGTTLAKGALPNSEIAQRIKSAMGISKNMTGGVIGVVFSVPSHPPMLLEPRFVSFVSVPPARPSPYFHVLFLIMLRHPLGCVL